MVKKFLRTIFRLRGLSCRSERHGFLALILLTTSVAGSHYSPHWDRRDHDWEGMKRIITESSSRPLSQSPSAGAGHASPVLRTPRGAPKTQVKHAPSRVTGIAPFSCNPSARRWVPKPCSSVWTGSPKSRTWSDRRDPSQGKPNVRESLWSSDVKPRSARYLQPYKDHLVDPDPLINGEDECLVLAPHRRKSGGGPEYYGHVRRAEEVGETKPKDAFLRKETPAEYLARKARVAMKYGRK